MIFLGLVGFQMSDVLLLDPPHQAFSLRHVAIDGHRSLLGHNGYLIISCLTPGNRAARGNQMNAPLENQPHIPQGQQRDGAACQHRSAAFRKCVRQPIENAASPRMKIEVSETKNRFPNEEIPSQSW